ncbi:hypothetical protein Ddc_06637 [Ditylenchus destructor]|nr:hypothetical protein Ddc_06637 [Ditylenchus destructor]
MPTTECAICRGWLSTTRDPPNHGQQHRWSICGVFAAAVADGFGPLLLNSIPTQIQVLLCPTFHNCCYGDNGWIEKGQKKVWKGLG